MSAVLNQPAELSITELAKQLAWAKAQETAARDARLAVEAAILAHPDVAAALKEEGTTTVDAVKVVTGYSRTWDQKQLASIERNVDPSFWPFKTEFKEDRRLSKLAEERMPDLWELLRGALTLKPKKPAVSLVGDGEE